MPRLRVVKGMLRQIPDKKITEHVVSKLKVHPKIKKMFKKKALRKRMIDFLQNKE